MSLESGKKRSKFFKSKKSRQCDVQDKWCAMPGCACSVKEETGERRLSLACHSIPIFSLLSSGPIYLLLCIGRFLEGTNPLVGRGFVLLANAASLISRFRIPGQGGVDQVHSHPQGENECSRR